MWRGLDTTVGAVLVALLGLALVVAGDAHAATGELTFAQCIEDQGIDSEEGACTNAPGLFGAQSVAVSDDGKSVYAASAYDGAIARFNRNASSGSLTFAQCIEDEDEDLEGEGCTDAPGLFGATAVAVSADGRSVYAASLYDYAIVRFDRDPTTGGLTFAQCFEDEDSDVEGEQCADAPGLFGATSVALSDDGESLYAASVWDDAIVGFNRDATTGELTFVECIEDEDTNPEGGDCADAPGLFGAQSVAVSANGESLYAASGFDGAVTGFNRDTATGGLAFDQCIEDQDIDSEEDACADAPGLFGAASVAVSDDGKGLYTASNYDDAIDRFNRNATGGLTFAKCIEDEDTDPEAGDCTDAPGLFGAQSVAVSGDGRSLYAASLWDDAIARFDRDRTTGALAFAQCFDDQDTDPEGESCANAPGLYGASRVAVSGDGKSLYAASALDGAVDLFDREPLPPPAPPQPRPDGNGNPPPSNDFEIGKLKRNKKKGTAKLVVTVPGPGELELAKTKKVKGAEDRAHAAGEVKLPVKPKRKTKQKLNETGKAKAKASVTFTPDGGDPNTKTKRVKLVRRTR